MYPCFMGIGDVYRQLTLTGSSPVRRQLGASLTSGKTLDSRSFLCNQKMKYISVADSVSVIDLKLNTTRFKKGKHFFNRDSGKPLSYGDVNSLGVCVSGLAYRHTLRPKLWGREELGGLSLGLPTGTHPK